MSVQEPILDEPGCEPLPAGQLASNAVATIEEIHHAFLKAAQNELAELLQEPVAMNFQGAKQLPIAVAMRGTASGDRALQLDLAPLGASAYVIFPPALLFRTLDILLGTPAAAPAADEEAGKPRAVTGIELFILREFFEVFAKSLRAAWARVYPAAFAQMPASFEEDGPAIPEDGSESALALRSGVEMAGLAADFVLVLPTFLARMAQLSSAASADRDAGGEPAGQSILRSLGSATLSLDAVLQGATIRIRDLLAMAPGQVLTIGNSEDSSFDCLVNGKPRFTGSLVPSGERCALRIETLAGAADSQLMDGVSAER
ncbi:MAG TPA: FliM/FliN family flagellar motor switch protein [Bryobacteraceae bacterium]|jgi:flagellar motor switch protein FliM|nr:FliM/FliN family flagellar motor switch protein [Bryobacteraceae bacterium]